MKKLLTTVLILGGGIFSNFLTAQTNGLPTECRPDSTNFKQWYNRKTIVSAYDGDAVFNGQHVKNSLFGETELNRELQKVDGADEMYRRANRKYWTFITTSTIGGIFSGVGLLGLNFAETSEERNISLGMVGTGLSLSFLGAHYYERRKEGINQSFWFHNRQVLAKSLVQNSTGTACLDEFTKIYDEKTIFLSRYNTHTQNNRRSSNGFLGKNLFQMMKKSPSSIEQLNKYRANSVGSHVANSLSAVLLIGSVYRDINRFNRGQDTDLTGRLMLGGGLLGVLGASYLHKQGQKHLNQAVWYFNRDALLRSTISRNLDEIP